MVQKVSGTAVEGACELVNPESYIVQADNLHSKC